ncbi:MAG: xanthine dehydrogenase family protein molybdopterin-binding subunit, partial [Janthinobacterium lividum]
MNTAKNASNPAPARQAAGVPAAPPVIGSAISRVDGVAKVTGQARYTAEHLAEDMSYGVVVSSNVASARIIGFDLDAALRVDGVIDVITHENRPRQRSYGLFYKDLDAVGGTPFRPLLDERVYYSGQPVALVVAETFEAARYAASLVQVHYETRPHDTNLMANLERSHKPSRMKAGFVPPPPPRGEPDAAFDAAAVKIDAQFYSGVEHHNPLEMHATTVILGQDDH